ELEKLEADMAKKASQDVLRHRGLADRQSTTRRQYDEERSKAGLPQCCDNEKCMFHTQPLVWNDKPLILQLDHVNGNSSDDRLENLQLLCPNCHSRQESTGGRNIGRVLKSSGGHGIRDKKTGNYKYELVADRGEYHSPIEKVWIARGGGSGGGNDQ